jgi:hypothetical protein
MRVRVVCAAFLCLILLSVLASAAMPQYQAGKIVKVEKQESHAPSGGTDAAAKPEVLTYKISIQLGDKVYVCTYKTHSENDLFWTVGKDVQARVSGKGMYVQKANGKEAKGSILSRSSAANP